MNIFTNYICYLAIWGPFSQPLGAINCPLNKKNESNVSLNCCLIKFTGVIRHWAHLSYHMNSFKLNRWSKIVFWVLFLGSISWETKLWLRCWILQRGLTWLDVWQLTRNVNQDRRELFSSSIFVLRWQDSLSRKCQRLLKWISWSKRALVAVV